MARLDQALDSAFDLAKDAGVFNTLWASPTISVDSASVGQRQVVSKWRPSIQTQP